MGKNNGNSNGNGTVTTQPTVHLVLQGKGGIGKSVVASWLTEFLTTRGQKVCAIDADPVNRSLGQYKALGAEKLDLINQDGLIERSRFDRLVDRFATEDTVFVVDSGATAFLREAGWNAYVHVPISGGEMLNDTLLGFKTLATGAADKSIVIWINEYFGPVVREGKALNQMQVYLENETKVLASVGIPQRSPDTFG